MIPVMVGDSLTVGVEHLMPHVRSYARVGRPLAEGLSIIDSIDPPKVLVVALGTNDFPSVARFRHAVRHVQRKRHHRCTVWVTIRRRGYSYRRVNRVLRSAPGPSVRWARALKHHPHWLAGDGVHATTIGYKGRADLIRRAIRKCYAA